jgi:hypothetical protein
MRRAADILYQCEINACASADAQRLEPLQRSVHRADGDPRYFAARLTNGDVEAYVAVMVGKLRTRSTSSR